jgi:8-oxo-dGTP pyrophosphatase MutT (NUDIX family)
MYNFGFWLNGLIFADMYEIFLNERRIILADSSDPEFLNSGLTGIPVSAPAELTILVQEFLKNDHQLLALIGEPEWLWPAFQSQFLVLTAAGGVVKSDKGYLFIYRRGFWDLPKGKIDQGETPEEAALREVREETGLTQLTITGKLPATWHIYQSPWEKDKGRWILKETSWFIMKGNSDEPLIPESGEEIEKARWVKAPEIREKSENIYSSLQKILRELITDNE